MGPGLATAIPATVTTGIEAARAVHWGPYRIPWAFGRGQGANNPVGASPRANIFRRFSTTTTTATAM